MEDNRKLLSVKVVGWGVIAANALGIVLNNIIPGAANDPFISRAVSYIAMAAVFPLDFFSIYLKGVWSVPLYWAVMIVLCSFGVLRFNKFARTGFIVLNIVHIVILFYIVLKYYGQRIFLDYFFKLYFNLVASGSYVGFLTVPEVREQFKGGENAERFLLAGMRKMLLPPPGRASSPRDAHSYYNLGLAYSRLGRDEDAVVAIKKAVAINPDKDNFYFSLGMIYIKQERYSDAIAAFKEAVRINPDHKEACYNLGLAYHHEGCDKEAADILEKVSRIQPDNAEVYLNLGEAYKSVKRFKEALQAFQKSVELNPSNEYAYCQIGIIRAAELGQVKEARDAFEKAIRLKPGFVEAHFQLGMTCIRLERHKDALRAFKEVIRLDANNVKAHYQIGFVYAMIKDFDSARREYEFLKNADADLAATLAMVLQ